MQQELKGSLLKIGLTLNKISYLVGDGQLKTLSEYTREIEENVGELVKEIDRLEAKEEKTGNEELKEKFCDGYCQFPNLTRTQEDLDGMCKECPLNSL